MRLEKLPRGAYVVGVSGGVDSVVLLHMLVNRQPDNRYIVAHFDHGMRGDDSRRDAEFARSLAAKYGLDYESESVELGEQASEATARAARYDFLRRCRDSRQAKSIVLAHHQDDVLETIVINLIRGTGWRGLASLRSHPGLMRPMLKFTKNDIYEYAKLHNLDWNEDSTNVDTKYLRNYVRHKLLPGFSPTVRRTLLDLGESQAKLGQEIKEELGKVLAVQASNQNDGYAMSRYFLIMSPEAVALECLQAMVKGVRGESLERPQAELALLFAKTALPGKVWHPSRSVFLSVNRDRLFVELSKS